MNKIILGVICGLVFGVVDVLVMTPLKYENNRMVKFKRIYENPGED